MNTMKIVMYAISLQFSHYKNWLPWYFAIIPILFLSSFFLFFHRVHHKTIIIFITRFFQGGLDIKTDTCRMTCTLSRPWSEGPTRRPHTFFLPSLLPFFYQWRKTGEPSCLRQVAYGERERDSLTHTSSYTEATSRCLCSCNCLKKF